MKRHLSDTQIPTVGVAAYTKVFFFCTGLTKDVPPPEPDLPETPDHGPPRFIPDGEKAPYSYPIKMKHSKLLFPALQVTLLAGTQVQRCFHMIEVESQQEL